MEGPLKPPDSGMWLDWDSLGHDQSSVCWPKSCWHYLFSTLGLLWITSCRVYAHWWWPTEPSAISHTYIYTSCRVCDNAASATRRHRWVVQSWLLLQPAVEKEGMLSAIVWLQDYLKECKWLWNQPEAMSGTPESLHTFPCSVFSSFALLFTLH